MANYTEAFKALQQEDTAIFFDMTNPHRSDTGRHALYESVKSSTTVLQARQSGASLWDLKEWIRKGALTFKSGMSQVSAVDVDEIDSSNTPGLARDLLPDLVPTKMELHSPDKMARSKRGKSFKNSPDIRAKRQLIDHLFQKNQSIPAPSIGNMSSSSSEDISATL